MTTPRHLVVMGVSGTGKTTVAQRLAACLGRTFVEGDSLHPASNVAKMAAGTPLTDADRRPWLEELGRVLAEHERNDDATVLTCSALRRSYRDVLRAGLTVPGEPFFVHLSAPADVLQKRMESREHFMPPSLLTSQLATLEPLGGDEHGAVVDVTQPVDQVVEAVVGALDG